MMKDFLMSSIATFHTTKIIIVDNSRFPFVGSISKTMFRCLPVASKILEDYKKLPSLGPHTITLDMRSILDEAEKVKKGGKQKRT